MRSKTQKPVIPFSHFLSLSRKPDANFHLIQIIIKQIDRFNEIVTEKEKRKHKLFLFLFFHHFLSSKQAQFPSLEETNQETEKELDHQKPRKTKVKNNPEEKKISSLQIHNTKSESSLLL